MTGFFTITSILEVLMLMPCFYMVLQFTMTPTSAFILSCLFNLVVLTAIFVCKLKPGPFIYKLITVVISALIAFFTVGISLGGFIVAVVCVVIFSRVRNELSTGQDIAVQLATASIIINILLAIAFNKIQTEGMAFYGNIALGISVICSVIVLVAKQVDYSRRFGKNTMGISTTQRKNNHVFSAILLLILLVVGSFGQVAEIYKFVISLIGKFISLVSGLLTPKNSNVPVPQAQMQDLFEKAGVKDPSLLEKIFIMLIYVLGILILIGIIVLFVYYLFKTLFRMVLRLILWFRSGEHVMDRVYENGHTDEKESLMSRNLRNMAYRFHNIAEGIFKREVPYNKLPDDIAKVRRLLKYFIDRVRRDGLKVTKASTARELCRDAGGIAHGSEQFNAMLADCYDRARYDNTAPTKEQLGRLEEKLLKQ